MFEYNPLLKKKLEEQTYKDQIEKFLYDIDVSYFSGFKVELQMIQYMMDTVDQIANFVHNYSGNLDEETSAPY